MPKKTFTPEQIVAKMREIEVLTGQGTSIPAACKQARISDVSYSHWRQDKRIKGCSVPRPARQGWQRCGERHRAARS